MAKANVVEGLNCSDPAVAAIPRVLEQRLQEMCSLRKRALNFKDPEGVHDMRVSSRRLRSALRDFMPYLRKSTLNNSVKPIKKLADCLGTVRDQDVAIIALEKVALKMSPELSPGAQMLIAERKVRQKEARSELRTLLRQATVTQLESNFIEALKNSMALTPGHKKQTKSYRVFARSTVLGRLKELKSLSPGLYDPHKTKPHHEMRIAAKRLRYALELFAPCWGESLVTFAREVAKLQSSLGELHDCDLWIENFGARLKRKKRPGGPDAAIERDAMIWLLGYFSRLRAKHFRAALDRWHEWEAKVFIAELTSAIKN